MELMKQMNDQHDLFDEEISSEDETSDSALMIEAEDDVPVKVRTVILWKNDMLALLSLKTSARGGAIVRIDPRQTLPTAQMYEDSASAVKWFNRSLATSQKNGW